MSLSTHVDVDEIMSSLRTTHLKGPPSAYPASHATGKNHHSASSLSHHTSVSHATPYSSKYASGKEISKFKIPKNGAPADTVHQLLKDELDLDGRPNLNLASFVGTYMEPHAEKLIHENISKNLADSDEYPALMAIHSRCVSILAHLWGVQKGEKAVGTATTGSSEAIHLGGLAMKRRWQEKRVAEGKDTLKPNIIMGANAQVALEKFARYFEVEARILPVSEKSDFRLDPELVKKNLDENTIGVFVIMGSTYTGHYEPVQEISEILDAFQEKTGVDIPIHVDGASGGFIAPFTDAGAGPGKKWNFQLPRVKSINVSGHKFGLVYAGVGWIIWRDEAYLPRHLIFELHYLGGTEESYTLNFSRPGAQIIAQYFNLIHLGFEGYRGVMESCLRNARVLSWALERTGWFTCVSNIHRKIEGGSGPSLVEGVKEAITGKDEEDETDSSALYNAGLPVVAFRFSDEFKKEYPLLKQVSLSILLRSKEYIIPNYPLPPNVEGQEILRVVVRESMSLDLLDRLIVDIVATTEAMMSAEPVDLRVWAAGSGATSTSFEKVHSSKGEIRKDQTLGERPMSEGVHRSVC